MEKNNITLIVTMYNQKEMLNIGVKWLSKAAGINRIVLIDNGSDDGTAEMLPATGYEYISFDEGKQGYGTVWNAVIDNFQLDEIIVFMDIRYILGRNCLAKLAEIVQRKECGVAGPRSNGFRGVQYMPLDSVDTMLKMEHVDTRAEMGSQYATVVGIDAGIWAISREKLKENGRFNEKIVEPENVLVDYELRMIQAGYRAVVCHEAVVFDIYSGAGSDGTKEINNQGDREILKNNWNMNYFNRVPNSYLADLIKEDREAEFHVLEVGCDLGATLLEIQSRYPNSKVHGMEINPAAVNIAKYLVDVKEGNIEEEKVLFQEKFDYIIFGDVLEHLHNPQKTIRFCKEKLLKAHGYIIASIPNIMHISVMQQLLNGRFEYQDMGLLDRTHIHFFTYYEILRMFQQEGYSMEEIRTTSALLTEEQEELKTRLMEISQNVEMHMYDTYQYVVKARIKKWRVEMNSIERLQKIIDKISQVPYRGVYLWKYIEYEITSGIIVEYQNQEKNIVFKGLSDNIPDAPREQIEDTEKLLNNLDKKEILFGMIPLRRPYNGKLEHTAMDSYVSIMDLDKYTVIEPNYGGQEDEIVYTQNRVRFYPLGVIGKYGQDTVNENEIADFLVTHYIYPIEQEFGIAFPKQILLKCIFKLGVVLKERRAYLSFFGEVIEKVKPKVVCYTHGPDPILCFLREAAQEKGVPTVEIEHGGIIRNLIYPDSLAYSDYYLTHSDLLTKPMIEKGIKNVFTVGKPGVYSNVFQNINSDSPIVVSFISSLEKDLFLKALDLAKRLDKQKFLVVFKLHSAEQWSEEEMTEILQQNPNWQFLDGSVDVRDLYAISDIVVGVRSSGILDALPYSKMKILTIEDKHEKELLVGNLSFFHELDAMGDIIMVKDEEQLYQEVINYKRGECYRDTINHYWPSDSEERFKEFIQIFLEGNRP